MIIEEHPIKVAEGDWTAVVGIISGTFTQPMVLTDGTTIPPTGKKARMKMAPFARWNNDQIAEEILFWDRAEWMRQLGIANKMPPYSRIERWPGVGSRERTRQ